MSDRKPRLLGVPAHWNSSRFREAAQRWARCHASLSVYGAQRLEATGWTTLGFGARLVARAGFRQLAAPLATVWATYDETDGLSETIAEIALGQEGGLSPPDRGIVSALNRSEFALYTVMERSQSGVRLRCARNRTSIQVHATLSAARFVPGENLVARVAASGGLTLLVAGAYVRASDPRERSNNRGPGSEALRVALRAFADAELSGSPLEPRMVGWSLGELLALDAEFGRCERALSAIGPARIRFGGPTPRIVCERSNKGWLISNGRCSIERVSAEHCHPLDAELFRQCGLASSGAIPQARGSRSAVMKLCAEASRTLATRRAA